MKSATYVFVQKNFPKELFIPKFVIDRLISNLTSCHIIQGVIALVFSNRPRALRSSGFEITRAITP